MKFVEITYLFSLGPTHHISWNLDRFYIAQKLWKHHSYMLNAVYIDLDRQWYDSYTGKLYTRYQKKILWELLHGYISCVSTPNNHLCAIYDRNTYLNVYNSFVYKIRIAENHGIYLRGAWYLQLPPISNMSRTKSPNVNVFRLILYFSWQNLSKPGVGSRIMM